MADERRSDEEVLADLERSLTELDPRLSRRFHAPADNGSRHTRALTLAWLVWTPTWFITYLVASNPASLVLAATSAVAYPACLAVRGWWNRRQRTEGPR